MWINHSILDNYSQFHNIDIIYYKITYEGNTPHFESIIEKSEVFDYQEYCKFRDSCFSNSDPFIII